MARTRKPETQESSIAEQEKSNKRASVELDPDLAQKLRLLAAALDVKFPDLVNNRLTAMVDRELPEALARMGYSPESGGAAGVGGLK